MAATFNESQKIDYLWKKVGYGVAKTAGTTGAGSKEAFNESISSPLLYRGDLIWMQSDQITSSPPGSTNSIIQVYKDGGGGGYSPTVECTEDLTSPDNQTWNTNLSNWVPTQFGDNYLVQVYVANSGISNPQSVGTKLFQSGSGTDDTWFFDYQAGVLNFNGAVIPSQIVSPITGKSIYIVGYRYVGLIGVTNSSTNITVQDEGSNIVATTTINFTGSAVTVSNVSGVATVAITGGSGGSSNIANGTSNVSISTANGNITTSVAGNANIMIATGTGVNVAGTLNATGNITGGNFITAGFANIGTTLSVVGNANVGNLGTVGIIIATGNITGGNFITAGFANVGTNANIGTTLSVIGDANVGNLGTAGIIIATGNITGGNFITAGFANIGTTLSVTGNASANNLSVGTFVTSNLIPDANVTYNLGNATNRWKDLYLASSTIYLGPNSEISAGNLTNGNSNLVITLDGNVSTSVSGNANIIVATSTGVNVAGYLTATSNISGSNLSASANLSVTANANIGNIGTAGIVIATGNITGGNLITAGFANVGTNANIGNTLSVIGNANVGNLGTAGVIIATGNITGGNANLGNLATANYLSATGGSIAIGDGLIALAAGNAGIFTVGVYNINFGLNSNITMGSNTGNVIARGNMSTNTISVNSIQSKRITIAVGMNTVIDSFPKVDYRSVKYCIRIGSDSGYQAVEVLLVHNGLNSIITVYGSLSTSGSDLLVLSTSINGANVELIGNPVAGETNTTVNLVGIYIQD